MENKFVTVLKLNGKKLDLYPLHPEEISLLTSNTVIETGTAAIKNIHYNLHMVNDNAKYRFIMRGSQNRRLNASTYVNEGKFSRRIIREIGTHVDQEYGMFVIKYIVGGDETPITIELDDPIFPLLKSKLSPELKEKVELWKEKVRDNVITAKDDAAKDDAIGENTSDDTSGEETSDEGTD